MSQPSSPFFPGKRESKNGKGLKLRIRNTDLVFFAFCEVILFFVSQKSQNILETTPSHVLILSVRYFFSALAFLGKGIAYGCGIF